VFDDLSDEQLMLRYAQGDARAFDALIGRHYQPVFNFLVRNTGNSATAEELLQDVFMRVMSGAKKYEKRAKFTTWLYTIARNIVIDHSRKQKFRRHKSLDQPIGSEDERTLGDTVKDEHPSVMADRRYTDEQFKLKLSDAMTRMNEDQRMVFVLREFQLLSFQEIAQIVETSENTVKSRMRYALEFLRTALRDFAEGAP
jgi:RNA polymerase sigma-70 factor (ECF subfamily)